MRHLLCFMVGLCLICMAGCASIVSDSTYPVTISSTPKDAQLTIKNDQRTIYSGTTPATVTLDASEGFFQSAEYTAKIDKQGYGTYRKTINAGLDGWYIGNIAFGGLIGWLIVDPATGAMWKLDSNVNANLSKKQSSSKDHKLYIATPDQIPQKMHSQLERIN